VRPRTALRLGDRIRISTPSSPLAHEAKAAMATATAAGGPDRMAAPATAAGLTGAVAAQRLLSLLALAVSILLLFPPVRPV